MAVFFLLFLSVFGCKEKTENTETVVIKKYKTVAEIPPPIGYTRDSVVTDSFALYLQRLELKEDNVVHLYNGKEKANQDAQYAVIKMDVGNRDLQQCADAIIRLRAEYFYARKEYSKIHFNFTSGERADYTEYAEGFRPVVLNNRVRWTKNAKKDYSYATFRKYLDVVFTYAGTLSLHNELKKAHLDELKPGDVFIQIGYPYGHAVIVVDVAVNKETGKKAFMLAQSYMPAQEIHILKNPEETNSPWYIDDFHYELATPEWTFKAIDLKRFQE